MQQHTATYSPEDNKLRLYPAARLDPTEYALVKGAGFIWAPKQELFVAPMWTPEREDLLIELCGEIGDEDTTLVDRAEDRAERFEDYSHKRGQEAQSAYSASSDIAERFAFGQPILVGHHSERKARKDAEKIENNMRRAVNLWKTSEYWTSRAAGAIRHAKYKERPDVRARRIKTIESDLRREQRSQEKARICLKFWTKPGLTLDQARILTGRTECGYLHLQRKEGDNPDFSRPSAYDVLREDRPSFYAARTLQEVIEQANIAYPATMARCQRWIDHYQNRIAYEKAMLAEQGASSLLEPKPRPKQLPLCNYRQEKFQIENLYSKGTFETWTQKEMTTAEYKRISDDWKGTRIIDNSHRVRIAVSYRGGVCEQWVVFLTDSKEHKKPEPIPDAPKEPRERPTYQPREKSEEAQKFEALQETLRAGVKIVSAPQLFPTPPDAAARLIRLADIQPGQDVLEPSAGTGNLLRAMPTIRPGGQVTAVEISYTLSKELEPWADVNICADFLEWNADHAFKFDRIIMNPPFVQGADIKHILHAQKMLRPGGKLTAICAAGPRQHAALQPLADHWEPLPEGTFADQGTNVNTVLLQIVQAPLPAITAEKAPAAAAAPDVTLCLF